MPRVLSRRKAADNVAFQQKSKMQPIKAPRLSKSKSSSRLARVQNANEVTFKASYDDLRNPAGRQSLRQHFTGAFPEAQLRPSLDSLNDGEVDGANSGVSRSGSSNRTSRKNSFGMSSPSSDSLDAAAAMKRLSTVRESKEAIDISQAIRLLEEIKKTATAAELVALHKALLPSPSRESMASPNPGLPASQEDPFDRHAAQLVRRKSMLPPGVATRNASQDLLRTPEEAAATAAAELEKRRQVARKARKDGRERREVLVNQETSPPRAATPLDDEYLHIGAYRAGTLRVTNGTASPDPSMMRRTPDHERASSVDDYETAPSSPHLAARVPMQSSNPHQPTLKDLVRVEELLQAQQMAQAELAGTPVVQKQESMQSLKSRRASEPAMSGIPVPEDRDTSSPRFYRPYRPDRTSESREHSRERSLSIPVRSRASSFSHSPTPAENNPLRHAQQQPPQQASMEVKPLQQLSYIVTQTSANKGDNDVSPIATELLRPNNQVDMPRFAQRLGYRISQLPPESEVAAQLQTTEAENKEKEKSPVEVTVTETAEIALAKLNGVSTHPALRKTPTAESNVTALNRTQSAEQRPSTAKADSGYGSDISNSAGDLERKKNHHGPVMVYLPLSRTESHLPAHKTYPSLSVRTDEVNAYTSDQAALSTPFLCSSTLAPSAPQTRGSKKHLSLLGLSIGKKAHSSPSTPDNVKNTPSQNQPTASPYPYFVEPASPSAQKPSASLSKKKLQKAMPPAVKQEYKTQRRAARERANTELSATTLKLKPEADARIPDVPDEMRKSFWRRSALAPEVVVASEPQVEGPVQTQAQGDGDRSWMGIGLGRRRSRSTSVGGDRMAAGWRSGDAGTTAPRSRAVTPGGIEALFNADGARGSTASTLVGESSHTPNASTHNIPEYSAPRSAPRSGTVSVAGTSAQSVAAAAQARSAAQRTQPGVFVGMEASAASELARSRSRDVGQGQKHGHVDDQPRTATPRSRTRERQTASTKESPTASTTPSIPTSQHGTPDRDLHVRLIDLSRSASTAESIPPVPQMPPNMHAGVARINGIVARSRAENQAQAEAGMTLAAHGLKTEPENVGPSGYSTESIADALMRHSSSKPPRKSKSKKRSKILRRKEESSDESEEVEFAVPRQDHDGEEAAAAAVVEAVPPEVHESIVNELENEPPSWDDHARAWRQKRQSAGQTLGQPVPELGEPEQDLDASALRSSMSSVHTIPRKPVPPARGSRVGSGIVAASADGNANTTAHARSASAEEHAGFYRDLIRSRRQSANQPSYDGTDWEEGGNALPTSMNAKRNTMSAIEGQGKADETRVDSAYSTKSFPTSTTRAPAPAAVEAVIPTPVSPDYPRPRTSTDNYPSQTSALAEAVAIQTARDQSLAQLIGEVSPTPRSTSAQVPPLPFLTKDPRPHPHPNPSPYPRPQSAHAGARPLVIGRYSGGLQLAHRSDDWVGYGNGSRGEGMRGGRPDTGRVNHELWGVDFSDVPVLRPVVQTRFG